jgi:protein-disulfide isomerase
VAPSPAPEPSTSTTTTAALETMKAPEPPTGDDEVARLRGELERARAEVKELKATLDDPQKFQVYQTERAAQAFEHETRRVLALEGVPFKGPAEAPIQVVEFSDFLCPFCRNLASAFNGFMPGSQGRVAIFFKNYPLDQDCNPALSRTVHEGACELALGAICAHEQGKFWPYHDRVFSQPPENPSAENVVGIAASAGLDGNALRQCIASGAAREKLDRDIQEARGLQITATPTVYINGKKLDQIPAFLKAIELEMKRLGLSAASP